MQRPDNRPPDKNNATPLYMQGNRRPGPGEARSLIVNVRLTADEKETLREFCMSKAVSMSDLLRVGAFAIIAGEDGK